jgi:site-specific recombinase XerD
VPSVQRGSIVKRGKSWGVRFYDADGTRRSPSGFATRRDAAEFLDRVLEEAEALRRGDVAVLRRRQMPVLAELVDEFLHQRNAEPNTLRTLTARLRYATEGPALDGQGGFAEVRIDRLEPRMIGAWRKRLPERSAHAITKALRQVLHYAVRAKLVDENVAVAVPNPEPKRREIPAFSSLEELEAVGEGLAPDRSALPIVVGLTGLRPEEWIALERRDVDRVAGSSMSAASSRTGR